MKKYLLNLLLVFGASTILYGQDFKNCENIGEDECVIYLYRLKNMVGGSVKWPIYSMEYDVTLDGFSKNKKVGYGKLAKLEYKTLRLKANTFYWLAVGEKNIVVLFSGAPGSETVVQAKGFKCSTSTIKGEALVRTNSESGFKIKEGDFKAWSVAVKDKDSYANLDINNALMGFGFEIQKANNSSELYNELKTMSAAKK